MAKGTTSIRLTVETVERMRAEIAKLLAAVEAGQRRDPGVAAEQINPRAQGLSYDQLINLLLDQRETQRRRDRRHRAKKRGEGQLDQGDE
jgi:hypothetical protein